MESLDNHIKLIKKYAHTLGFEYCGIAKAAPLYDDARRLEQWLNKGYHGKMKYMENWFDIRTNPTLLVPNAQTVISLLYNYFPQQVLENDVQISKYAYSQYDYHAIIKTLLKEFQNYLKTLLGNIEGRGFIDSAPVLERTWANKSGLGWIGKNGNLITRKRGSFFFIATLIIDKPLVPDTPFVEDYCGNCTYCIDACPTQAILPNKIINANHCIAYLTIELKDEIFPQQINYQNNNWIFGCDICQDVCPWNRFKQPNTQKVLQPIPEFFNLSSEEWLCMEEDIFKKLFGKSALMRAKLHNIKRNILFKQSPNIQADSQYHESDNKYESNNS